jgi:intermembrane space import and assembly protein 40
MYGSELEDDEDEVEEELRARETQGGALESTTAGPETVLGQSQPAPTADHAHHDAQDGPAQNGKAGIAQFNGDEGGELVPRGEHVSSHPNQKTTGKTA